MIGVLLTLAIAVGATGLGNLAISHWSKYLDPALKLAFSGLAGLGILGLLTLFLGLFSGGYHWGIYVVALFAIAGLPGLLKLQFKVSKPQGLEWAAISVIAISMLISLVGVLSPCDINDWDSLSYHLAAPKLLLEAGKLIEIPAMHQSNFPGGVDYLYIWGISFGGESGAKAFSFVFFSLGTLATFGVARGLYGRAAGLWAAVGFCTVPVLMWEAGTAYIDLANGIYSGLGLICAAQYLKDKDSDWLVQSGLMLGFAAASKYTGLQMIAAVGLCLMAFGRSIQSLKNAVFVGVLAIAIACPWYFKTAVYMHNPVYPFFFEKLGGKNWDQGRADIYKNEQQTFGVGRTETGRDQMAIGSAVLGLAYQPGRFVNPGQTVGLGTPLGAIGGALLLGTIAAIVFGSSSALEGFLLCAMGFSVFLWFFLSQQSRYIVPLVIPMTVLSSGVIVRTKLRTLLAGAISMQAIYSLWLLNQMRVSDQIQVVSGKISAEEYQAKTIPFYAGAQVLNSITSGGKVALYNETFGYLLNVPYMWANPGHSTLIDYENMPGGRTYAAKMKALGFTHVYFSLSQVVMSHENAQVWMSSAGLDGPTVPYPDREARIRNWQERYLVLTAEAVASGELEPVQILRNGIILKFR